MENRAQPSDDLLRTLDYDRYLANLYLPQPIRDLSMVLDAFDAEIGRIAWLITEPMAGEIRLQWWRDILSGERSGEARNTPLAAALLEGLDRHNLPEKPLLRYLEARLFDLYQDPMPDLATFEGYCGETRSVFFQLKLNAWNPDTGINSADLCGYAGMAVGIANTVTQLHFAHATSRIFVPSDLLKAAGLSPQEWLSKPYTARHTTAVEHLIETGLNYHDRVQDLLSQSGETAIFPLFLPLALTRASLVRAKSMGTALFSEPPRPHALKKHWILWRSMRQTRV